MASTRKIKANRANARASTGPRTAQGKSIAAQNARRHGLSLSVISDPVLSGEVEVLAREIASEASDDNTYRLARRIAEAQIDLLRVRRARYDRIIHDLFDPNYKPRESNARILKGALLALRVEQLQKAQKKIPHKLVDALVKYVEKPKPQGLEKFMHILCDFTPQIIAIDRYERRALSRRKFAIRALDALRRQTAA